MINLINKLLDIFNLKLVSTKPVSLVKETVKFLDTFPKNVLHNFGNIDSFSNYVGDVNYVKKIVKGEFPQVSGKTYICGKKSENKYFYNYEGEEFTPDQLQEKLND